MLWGKANSLSEFSLMLEDRTLYRYALSYSKVTPSLEAYQAYAGHPHTTLTQGHPTPNSLYKSLQRPSTS